ncbi:hypothetical protein PUN28_007741 [Cardiocondyla obscurior]|uniref:Uncharacterized protein n=1 Tax=Cardiocondyla obscurior TaxID=286306 RepID=A0AAW2FW78_9HYME
MKRNKAEQCNKVRGEHFVSRPVSFAAECRDSKLRAAVTLINRDARSASSIVDGPVRAAAAAGASLSEKSIDFESCVSRLSNLFV